MHRILLVLTYLALAACSRAEPEPVPEAEAPLTVVPESVEVPAPEPEVEAVPAPPLPAEKPTAPGITLDDLIGMNDEAVLEIIGEPDLRQDRAPAVAWIYDAEGCRFGLLLYPDLETNRRTVLSYETEDPANCAVPMVRP